MKQEAMPNTNHVPPAVLPSEDTFIDYATLELLARWRAEDATDDPEVLGAAERDLAQFKKAMNDSRKQAGELPLFP